MVNIQTRLDNDDHYDGGNNIQYIIIHDTGNFTDTDEGNANYFDTGSRQASAHYFVDDDSITQIVLDKDGAWSVGDGAGRYGITNSNSLNIEMCRVNGLTTELTRANTIDLVKVKMAQYNVPFEKVVRHYDASRKNCPSSLNINGDWSGWVAFKNQLSVSLGQPQSNIQPVINAQNSTDAKIAQASKFVVGRVLELQQKLNKVMGTKIDEDNLFGGQTYGLIIAFQKKYRLTVDGLFGQISWAKLGEVIASLSLVKPTPQSTPVVHVVSQSVQDTRVKQLQHSLNRLFNSALVEDNSQGTLTSKAMTFASTIFGVSGLDSLLTATNQVLSFPYDAVEAPHLEYATRYIQYRIGLPISGVYDGNVAQKVANWQSGAHIGSDGKFGNQSWTQIMK